jgi:protein-tyrosine phosphatase
MEMHMSYAEIHFHLLCGIDDGPPDLEASVALARAAAQDGTSAILTTPHIHPEHVTDVRVLPGLVHAVSKRLADEGVVIELHCGGELDVAMVACLDDDELDVIATGAPSGRWLLLESPLAGLGPSYSAVADELRARGFGVVMAHPERSMRDRRAGWAAIEHEVAAGSVIQVNAWSVCGRYGERVRAEALAVVRDAPRVALASDAHGPHRPPFLTPGLAEVERVCGAAVARRVAAMSPRLLTDGLPRPEALAA